MSDDITGILEDLAAGRIDATEASRRIDEVRSAPDPHPYEQPPRPTAQEASGEWHDGPSFATYPPEQEAPKRRRSAGTNGVDRISVRAVGRRVRVVGDSGVATVAVNGPHVLRRNGSVLEVNSDGDAGPSLDGFSLLRARSLDDLRSMSIGKELELRVNPAIVADIEVTAGSLTTEGVPYLGKVRLTAGSAALKDVAEAADVLAQAGQVTLEGTITSGRSRLRCESGSVTVHLGAGSSVVVHGESQLGRIAWSGHHEEGLDEVVLGSGAARLDLSVVMGYATVRLPDEVADPEDLR